MDKQNNNNDPENNENNENTKKIADVRRTSAIFNFILKNLHKTLDKLQKIV